MQLTCLALDDPAWISWLGDHSGATPLHHPAWGSVVTGTYGFRAFVAVTRDERGSILAGLPLAEVGGGRRRRWVALPFTDRCPPLLAPSAQSEDFTSALEQARADEGIRQVEVRGELEGALRPAADAVMHTLVLDPDPDVLMRRFHPSQVRRNLRRAERGPVRVRRSTDARDLLEGFYGLHLRTRRRLGVPTQPQRFFRLIAERILEPELGHLLIAELEGRPIAAALFLAWNQTVVYKFGASDAEHWEHRPNHLIFWEAIRTAAETGHRVFDFGRTDLDATGLRAFKGWWGAEERPLFHSYLGESPRGGRRRAARLLRPVIRHAPLWVCRRIGERLYRFAA
jgi:CelD/BcsL family acetyltransferase involved in cellulose biosynthesis